MSLDGSLFGFEAVSHEGDQILDDGPVAACPKGPEKRRVCACEIVVFECLSRPVS